MPRPARLLPVLLLAFAAPAQIPLLRIPADPAAGSQAGKVVARIGDLDRDGFQDFVVGLPNDAQSIGAAHVYSGRDGHRLLRVTGDPAVRAQFGNAVGAAGDVNLDGYPDFLVAGPVHPRSGVFAGYVQCLSGRDGSVIHTIYARGPGDLFGTHVSGVGDLDGDGHPDFAAGAPENGDPVQSYGNGYARVFSGKTGAVIRHFEGYQLMSEFGHCIMPAGDVDKDGTPDLLIGSTLEGMGNGSARLFSGRTGKMIYNFPAPLEGDHFGVSVGAAGDVDGDGYLDLLVGNPNPYSFLPGAVFVYSGRTGKVLHHIEGSPTTRMFGVFVTGVGDLDGDGRADFASGDPADTTNSQGIGSLRIFSGRTGSQLAVIYGDGDGLGWTAADMGDMNGDGRSELLVGRPGALPVPRVELFTLSVNARFGFGCSAGRVAPSLDASGFQVGNQTTLSVSGGANQSGGLFFSGIPDRPTALGPRCDLHLQPATMLLVAPVLTDGIGRWQGSLSVPGSSALIGLLGVLQCAIGPTTAPLGFDASNGVFFEITK